MPRLYGRSSPASYIKRFLVLLCAILIIDFLYTSWIFAGQRAFLRRSTTAARPIRERVFIASTHWNNEAILRSHWNTAVLELVKHIGPENVYVSIRESGSWDNSKGALREFDLALDTLGVRRSIILDKTTHADEIAYPPAKTGWIDTPRGKRELRRIPYLANIRNSSLKPLEELAAEGILFDKILFLNDVVFSTEDVRRLFATRDGDYAAACSMDFSKPPNYYDTFALRDMNGDGHVTQTFPYFGSSASRAAQITGNPVPLQSCWNGMVVFDASPFYRRYGSQALQFRGIPDSLAKYHLEGSECCLIHFDNPLSSSRGVWMNPLVRVGYNPVAYDVVAGSGRPWPSWIEQVEGIWRNRLARWVTGTWPRRRRLMKRLRSWEAEQNGNHEPGFNCLVDEMQVLVANGWAHV